MMVIVPKPSGEEVEDSDSVGGDGVEDASESDVVSEERTAVVLGAGARVG